VRPQSAKAKGRRLQQEVRDAILATFDAQLQPDDVRSTSMGASGEDLLLSPAARAAVPFSIECKNVESLNIWKALEQAGGRQHPPLVVFRRNGTKAHAALPFDVLLELLRKAYGADRP
jgi:hypothetical protein